MGELTAHDRTLRLAQSHGARQWRDVRVAPQTQIIGADASAWINGSRLGDD
jgi:hypothetical protein